MHKKAKGFSLIELLCTLTIMGVIFSAAAICALPKENEMEKVRRSAQRTATWIKRRIAAASREGASFNLTAGLLPGQSLRDYSISIYWLTGNKTAVTEKCPDDECILSLESKAQDYQYNGRWHTLTPAVTFMVKSEKDRNVRLFITISGTGYVDIKEKL